MDWSEPITQVFFRFGLGLDSGNGILHQLSTADVEWRAWFFKGYRSAEW